MKFKGVFVPLVTPFDGGRVDLVSLGRIMERCLKGGADGFVALGTTAETPTLSLREREEILKFALNESGGKPVVAGAGSNCTAEAAMLASRAEELGADAVLSVCPYYSRPQQTGIVAHFIAVAEAVKIPVILYNVPKRTGAEISDGALAKLAGIYNIVGIKEADGRRETLFERAKYISGDFSLFAGADELLADALEAGADGAISAAANVIPTEIKQVWELFCEGRRAEAKELAEELREKIGALYVETNPSAIKYALMKMGLSKNELRLPMCPISHKNELILDKYF